MSSELKRSAQILDLAADLLAKPGAWTQGASARTAAGNPISAASTDAVCWSGVGAVFRVCPGIDNLPNGIWDLMECSIQMHFDDWNDAPERTQAEVVAMLRYTASLGHAEAHEAAETSDEH